MDCSLISKTVISQKMVVILDIESDGFFKLVKRAHCNVSQIGQANDGQYNRRREQVKDQF